jgi:hypothetical protein
MAPEVKSTGNRITPGYLYEGSNMIDFIRFHINRNPYFDIVVDTWISWWSPPLFERIAQLVLLLCGYSG